MGRACGALHLRFSCAQRGGANRFARVNSQQIALLVVQQIGSLGGFRLLFASFWLLLVMLCVIISNIEGCAHF